MMLALACIAGAQQPTGVTLTLSTKGDRTQFRMGEQIDVDLHFVAAKPGACFLSGSGIDRRYVRQPEFDFFTTEPEDAAADPLIDSGTLVSGGLGRLFGRVPLTSTHVPGIVNDWISFRKPGRYRVVAHSTRVSPDDAGAPPATLHSNAIEIEIMAAEPEWRKRQLQEALSTLAGDPSAEEEVRKAARTLRFLETRDVVPHLARLFENGPLSAQQDLRAGLLASPYRDEVIAAMEQAMEAPGFPVTAYWLGTLMQIEYSRRYGARDPMPQNDPEALRRWMEADKRYTERFRPIQEAYTAKLAAAVSRKQEKARAVSLEALLTGSDPGSQPAVRKALVSNFAALPADVQWRLLMQWRQIGGADLEPALRIIAARPGQARDVALERLLELNPAAARQIVIDRLRAGDLGDPRGQEPRSWLFLPDKELPEIEAALAASLTTNPAAGTLVARYATPAVLPQVLAALDRNPQAICHSALSAYLFRVDPVTGRQRLALAREQGSCALYIPQHAAALVMSPALEQAAITDLASPDPMVRRSAQSILQYGGSAAAEQPLWDSFSHLRGRPLAPLEDGVEVGFVDALIKSYGWVLTPEKLDAVAAHCITDRCRDFARSERRWLDRPVRIIIGPEGPWSVMLGGAQTYTQQQTRDKLRQFPRGTTFQMPPGNHFPARTGQIRTMLSEAGMAVVN